jgi:hypothetical protein
VQKNIWTSNLNMSLNANGSLNFNGSASSPHQHIVGRSLQDANSHIAGLRSSGVTVRVHQPGQVTWPRLTESIIQAAFHSFLQRRMNYYEVTL